MSDLKSRVQTATTTAAPAAEQPEVAAVVDISRDDSALNWLERRRSYFIQALPRHVDEGQFIQTALSSMQSLKNCRLETVFTALMECARYGLAPDGKHAAIIPYKNVATFQPMYQGYIELMYRSGMIDSVVFDWIHERDSWHMERGQRPPNDFSHKPDLLSKDRGGTIILAYAFAWMRGGGRSQVIALNRFEAEYIRDNHSKAFRNAENNGKKDSTWHTHFDDMWAKSAVIRLNKRVPTSPEIRELIRHEDANEGYGPPIIRAEAMPRDDWADAPGSEPATGEPEPQGEADVRPEAVKPGEG